MFLEVVMLFVLALKVLDSARDENVLVWDECVDRPIDVPACARYNDRLGEVQIRTLNLDPIDLFWELMVSARIDESNCLGVMKSASPFESPQYSLPW